MNWYELKENQELFYSIAALFILLLFLLLRRLFAKYLYKFILKILNKTPSDFLSTLWISFEKPAGWLFVVFGFYVSARYFPYIDTNSPLFINVYQSLIIVIITQALFNVTSTASVLFKNINERLHIENNKILVSILSRLLRVIIIAIAAVMILEKFEYDISGFIAGLGLGGLAFALAAQDALKNFFGGIVIVFEKPFTIGDWILTPSVEGTVEEITFRSTKVRTFAEALVTVPNSTLANEAITNWSKMGKRRVDFHIELDYKTPPEKLKTVVDRIKNYLKNHPGVHPETINVTFNRVSERGHELYFYFFTNTTVWGEYMEIKQDVNFKIIGIFAEEKVEIALPSRSLYLKQMEDDKLLPKKEREF